MKLPTFKEVGIYHYIDLQQSCIVSVCTEFINPDKMYDLYNKINSFSYGGLEVEIAKFRNINSYLYELKPEKLIRNKVKITKDFDFNQLTYLGHVHKVTAQFLTNIKNEYTFTYIANNKYIPSPWASKYSIILANKHIKKFAPLYIAYIYAKAFHTFLYTDNNRNHFIYPSLKTKIRKKELIII